MAGSWRIFFSLYFISGICGALLFHFLINGTSGYLRLHVMRTKAVMKYEYMMILGSLFLWNRMKAAYQSPVSEKHSHQPHSHPSQPRTASVAITALIITGAHVSYLSYYVQGWVPFVCTWLVHICTGLWIHMLLFLVGFSVVNFVTRIASHNIVFFRALFKRRYLNAIFMDTSVQTTISILLTIAVCAVSIVGGFQLDVRQEYLKFGRGGRHLKMVVLSDIHAGPTVSKWHVERAVSMSNEQDPDVVVITGDLVDGSVGQLSDAVSPLKELKSKQGIFFVTGNHEYYYGKVGEWIDELKKMNIQTLRNSNVMLSSQNGTKICLAGVDDILTLWLGFDGHKMDWESSIKDCEKGAPIVLLAHNPLVADRVQNTIDHKVDLIISGHIHGGQFYVTSPVFYFLLKYFRGLYETPSGAQLFVTSGAYYWGIPMKRAFTSEVLVMNLR